MVEQKDEVKGVVVSQRKVTLDDLNILLESWGLPMKERFEILQTVGGRLVEARDEQFSIYDMAEKNQGVKSPITFHVIEGENGAVAVRLKFNDIDSQPKANAPIRNLHEQPPSEPLPTRPLKRNEKKYYYQRQMRIFPVLISSLSLWLMYFYGDLVLLSAVGTVLAACGLYFFFRNKPQYRAGVAFIRGKLCGYTENGQKYPSAYAISGILLRIPKYWRDSLVVDREYRAGIILDDKDIPPQDGLLVSLDENLEIDRDVATYGAMSSARYLVASLLFALTIAAFLLYGEDNEDKLAFSWRYFTSHVVQNDAAFGLLKDTPSDSYGYTKPEKFLIASLAIVLVGALFLYCSMRLVWIEYAKRRWKGAKIRYPSMP